MKQQKLLFSVLLCALSFYTPCTWTACARFCDVLKNLSSTQPQLSESETKVHSSVTQPTVLMSNKSRIRVPQKLHSAYVWFSEKCVTKETDFPSYRLTTFIFTPPEYTRHFIKLSRCTTSMKCYQNGDYSTYSKLEYTDGRTKMVTLPQAQKLILNIGTVNEWGSCGAIPFFHSKNDTTPAHIIITEPVAGNTITLEPHDGVLKTTRVFHINTDRASGTKHRKNTYRQAEK